MRTPDDVRVSLVSIPTPTTPLDGLLYEPRGEVRGSVVYFHGNTMNFYTGGARFLPPMLTRLSLAVLAFNRRGHDILSVRDDKEHPEGAAFQTTAQSLEDDEIAVRWLADVAGHAAPIVVGHSNGGMIAVRFVADHPETPALVLLSAGRGGPATAQRPGLLAGADVAQRAEQARELVSAGRGGELMRMSGWWYLITAESFLDRLETVPDIIDLAPRIACPSLFVRGSLEPVDTYPAEHFARESDGPARVEIIPGADHFYRGAEAEVADLVASFLRDVLTEGDA